MDKNPNQPNIIAHVPGQEELANRDMLNGRQVPRSEVRAILAQLDIQAPTGVVDTTPPAPTDNARREAERQMSIATADRANREAAGLPPRTHDLR